MRDDVQRSNECPDVLDRGAPLDPFPALKPTVRAGLIETARRLDPLVLRWSR